MNPLLLRLLPYLLGGLAIVGGIWYFSHVRFQAGYEAATEKMQVELEKERQLRKETDWKVRQDYEARISELNANAVRELRGRPIRCVLGNTGQVREGRDTSGSVGSAAGGSAVQPPADLRPRLVRAGETCERLRQQLMAIKARQELLR